MGNIVETTPNYVAMHFYYYLHQRNECTCSDIALPNNLYMLSRITYVEFQNAIKKVED